MQNLDVTDYESIYLSIRLMPLSVECVLSYSGIFTWAMSTPDVARSCLADIIYPSQKGARYFIYTAGESWATVLSLQVRHSGIWC